MDDNSFWTRTQLIALAVIIAIIGSCQSTKYQMRKAIEAGATPLEAKCAFSYVESYDCILLYHSEASRD
jgi:alkylhydroperoxidase/carboxymuconolactone decarboxylase family protein YurZ